MPGYRHRRKPKASMLQVRVDPETLKRWKLYMQESSGYLSVLVRRAVDEHLVAHPKPKGRPVYYAWPERWGRR